MGKPAIDVKRTDVKASLVPCTKPNTFYVEHRLHGPYGAFLDMVGMNGSRWILCCPGCGEAGSPNTGAKWTIVAGSFSNVSELTLSPSIANSCCGWHGYLKNGVFESC